MNIKATKLWFHGVFHEKVSMCSHNKCAINHLVPVFSTALLASTASKIGNHYSNSIYVRFVVSIQSRICSGPMFSLLHLKAQQHTIVNVHFWLNFKHSPRRAPAGAGPWAHLHPSAAGRWKRTQSHEAESDHILRQAVLPFLP